MLVKCKGIFAFPSGLRVASRTHSRSVFYKDSCLTRTWFSTPFWCHFLGGVFSGYWLGRVPLRCSRSLVGASCPGAGLAALVCCTLGAPVSEAGLAVPFFPAMGSPWCMAWFSSRLLRCVGMVLVGLAAILLAFLYGCPWGREYG